MFYRNGASSGSAHRYVRGADGREYFTAKTSSSFSPTAERRMTSKYDGACKACGQTFSAGTEIFWSKAGGAKHVSCPVQERAAAKVSVREEMMDDDRMMAEMEMAADREGTARDNAAKVQARSKMETADAADALLEEYAAAQRATALQAIVTRKLVYRVNLTGEAKRYGVDLVNVEIVPNAKYQNAKIGEFRGQGVGRLMKDGTVRYWNDVNPNDERVKAVVAAVEILLETADPITMAKAYALEAKECMRCGDALVDDGNPYYPYLGPVCGKKFNKGE